MVAYIPNSLFTGPSTQYLYLFSVSAITYRVKLTLVLRNGGLGRLAAHADTTCSGTRTGNAAASRDRSAMAVGGAGSTPVDSEMAGIAGSSRFPFPHRTARSLPRGMFHRS